MGIQNSTQSVTTVIKGLTIYIVASIVSSVVKIIAVLMNLGTIMCAASTGDMGGAIASLGFTAIITLIVGLAVLYGIWLYYSGLQQFAPELDEVGTKAVGNLSNAALLMLIAQILTMVGIFVPIIGSVIAMILVIIAFVLNIVGYSALRNSASLNSLGQDGAKQLFTGFICAIIAVCVSWIPVLGWIAAIVLNILYWVYLFKGWGKIRQSLQ